jgi:hypothetical protein
MTKDEIELQRRREKYQKNADHYRAAQKAYYWKNREFVLAKAALYRQRRREQMKRENKFAQSSVEILERELPVALRINIPRLRATFLKIPILVRPPYDVWLKMIVSEYYKELSQ